MTKAHTIHRCCSQLKAQPSCPPNLGGQGNVATSGGTRTVNIQSLWRQEVSSAILVLSMTEEDQWTQIYIMLDTSFQEGQTKQLSLGPGCVRSHRLRRTIVTIRIPAMTHRSVLRPFVFPSSKNTRPDELGCREHRRSVGVPSVKAQHQSNVTSRVFGNPTCRQAGELHLRRTHPPSDATS